jgi:hypothetical protein
VPWPAGCPAGHGLLNSSVDVQGQDLPIAWKS